MSDRKILIIQSDRAAAFPLAARLRKAGCAVLTAYDAAQAMQLARQQKPTAIVLHEQLAGGGGLAALKRLRSSVYTTSIPAICVVAPDSPAAAHYADAGAQEFIDPPGDPEEINAAVERWLGKATVLEVPRAMLASDRHREAVRATGLLDSATDKAFDDLTRLSAKIIGAPIALMTVVDAERQFFKSQVGLTEPWASRRQTPLTHSFCQWVVGGNEAVVVEDARQDPALRTNLAIRDLGVTAYAGVPVSAGDGEPIGSFCVIDSNPRQWTGDDIETLRDLSLVLHAHMSRSDDHVSNIIDVAAGVGGASRVLARCATRVAAAERRQLAELIEHLGHRLVQMAS